MIKIEECVGKRVLIDYNINSSVKSYNEVLVLELSPSGNFVKIRHTDNNDKGVSTTWEDVIAYEEGRGNRKIIDILGDIIEKEIKIEKPPKSGGVAAHREE